MDAPEYNIELDDEEGNFAFAVDLHSSMKSAAKKGLNVENEDEKNKLEEVQAKFEPPTKLMNCNALTCNNMYDTTDDPAEITARGKHILAHSGLQIKNCAVQCDGYVAGGTAVTVERPVIANDPAEVTASGDYILGQFGPLLK